MLGHELAHHGNRDTRFAVATYRGRVVIMRVRSGLDGASWSGRLVRPLFQAYGSLYFSVSARVGRAQELAADVASAEVAATGAAVGALRRIAALSPGWQSFVFDDLMRGWAAGSDESRARELAKLRRNPSERTTSSFDSHPAMPDRIAVLEAAPVVPVAEGGERPATELPRDAGAVLDAVWVADLPAEALAKQRTDWETDVSSRHDFRRLAATIANGRSIADFLDALDAGRIEDPADPACRFRRAPTWRRAGSCCARPATPTIHCGPVTPRLRGRREVDDLVVGLVRAAAQPAIRRSALPGARSRRGREHRTAARRAPRNQPRSSLRRKSFVEILPDSRRRKSGVVHWPEVVPPAVSLPPDDEVTAPTFIAAAEIDETQHAFVGSTARVVRRWIGTQLGKLGPGIEDVQQFRPAACGRTRRHGHVAATC
ncbi:M48 family metalloprotease [Amycolatopsis sp. FDAARGOS 1241]|uniref:M48 family metalloprotease n=1 Tax=Amycolatopsis sp. FDAARGOS 1241 TaxID=2778070 RepID=UPI001EF3D312|nr:M48 family metalloprotease [Amycolatopsis sp. FDAARGOS 1241]